MSALIAWLGTAAGRFAAKWGAVIALVAGVLWRAYASGKSDARAEQATKDARGEAARKRVDDDVAKMSDDARRRELAGWVRDRE